MELYDYNWILNPLSWFQSNLAGISMNNINVENATVCFACIILKLYQCNTSILE